jgi:hypothetical protein
VASLGFGGLPGMGVAAVLPGLLDQAGVALAVLDGDGRLTINSSMESVLGRPGGVIPAGAIAEAFQLHTKDGGRLLEVGEVPVVRARAGETIRDALITVKRPDGSVRYLRSNAVPLPAATGDYRAGLALVVDVTDSADGWMSRAQLHGGLVDWLNHELRTPLTSLHGHSELLDDPDLGLAGSAAASVSAMQRATRHLMRLADTITAMGHLDKHEIGEQVSGHSPMGVNAREVSLQGAEDSDTAAYRTTRYTVYPSGFSQVSDPERRHWLVRVEDAGDGWAIRWRSRCLNYRNVWEFEPSPKSRTDEFLQRCRFSERAALLRAKKAVDELQVDGMTYQEFIHQVRAGAASKARIALEAADSPSLADADGIVPVLPLHVRLKRSIRKPTLSD